MIRVVLCDILPVVLSGMSDILRGAEDVEITETCRQGEEALAAVRRHDPDLLIIAARMGDVTGLAVTRTVLSERRRTRVILLAGDLTDAETATALRVGVRGFIRLEMTPEELLTCVRNVHAGQTCLEPHTLRRTLERILHQDTATAQYRAILTPQEFTIAKLVVQGLRNRHIADQLGITEGTVKVHLHSVYKKLDIPNRVGLVLIAREAGFL